MISVKEKSKKKTVIAEALESRDPSAIPGWLTLEPAKREGKVERLPERSDITHPINERLIIELYSK